MSGEPRDARARDVDQRLVDAALAQVRRRWPETGEGVGAALYLDDGELVTSVALDNLNAAATLCAETGALSQAYTLGRTVAASVCVAVEKDATHVLAPCGICRERLALWGPGVRVAVADDSARGWTTRSLGELYPSYWGAVYPEAVAWRTV